MGQRSQAFTAMAKGPGWALVVQHPPHSHMHTWLGWGFGWGFGLGFGHHSSFWLLSLWRFILRARVRLGLGALGLLLLRRRRFDCLGLRLHCFLLKQKRAKMVANASNSSMWEEKNSGSSRSAYSTQNSQDSQRYTEKLSQTSKIHMRTLSKGS